MGAIMINNMRRLWNGGLLAKYWRCTSALSAATLLAAIPVHAADTYQTGHITRVSYVADHILIMIDTALPTNCAGTPFGWMMIAAANKPMAAFVTGLWMRGDAADKQFTFYTAPIDSSGFCQVYQLDTNAAG